MARHHAQPQELAGNRKAARHSDRRIIHRGTRRGLSMNIENFKPATVYTIYIASTPEKVWQALTSAEFSRKYFFGNAVEVDFKIGGAFLGLRPGRALHISSEAIECDAPPQHPV